MSQNARKATQPRYPVSFNVSCLQDDKHFDGTCRNISVGGMYIESSVSLTRDSEVSLFFRLPEIEESIQVHGKVRWMVDKGFQHGAGIQFLRPTNPKGIRPHHLWALNKFFSGYHAGLSAHPM